MNAATAAAADGTASAEVEFTLDGRRVTARAGESILQVARRAGIEIPHLCWAEG
ncbi:MAG: (2Fe-2S)-binding protein, partial [Rhodoferax sp.]|nr:(2Fe-2S)-binding protein [Rhodoferax sp.]